MAWAAISISGTKSSPALKRSPTSSMALISPSFRIAPMSVPASISAWVLADYRRFVKCQYRVENVLGGHNRPPV
jgi:hypothetical protein